MIEVEYQLTEGEWETISQMNGGSRFQYWHFWTLMITCCIPGLLLAIWLNELFSIVLHSVVLFVFFVLMFSKKAEVPQPTRCPISVAYDSQFRTETCGQSRTQFRLSASSELRETDAFLVIPRFGMSMMEPKRAFSKSQLEQVRNWLVEASQSAMSVEPLPLAEEVRSRSDRMHVESFRQQRSDLYAYKQGAFQTVSSGDMSAMETVFRPPKQRRWQSALALGWFILLALGLVWIEAPVLAWGLTVSVGLSVGLIYLGFKLMVRWSGGRVGEMLSDEYYQLDFEFGMTRQGWYMSSQSGVSAISWQDVVSIGINRVAILLTTASNAHLIPLRIFGSDEEAQRVIETTVRLHDEAMREKQRSEAVGLAVVESGNPFQAPQSTIPPDR